MQSFRRSHTLTNIFLAICALALGLAAQGYFAHPTEPHAPKPTDGMLVYVVVVVLFAVAVARTGRLSGGQKDEHLSEPTRLGLNARRLAWSTALFCMAGLLLVLSLLLFGEDASGSTKWALYLISIALLIGAVYVLTPLRLHDLRFDLSRVECLLLLLVLLIAAFFRLYRFGQVPYGLWYDEADNGLWARELLATPGLRPIYAPSTNLPTHFLYLVMFAFRLLGDSMWSIRAVAVCFGMLTVIAAYFCGREFFGWEHTGRPLGLILAFLLAVSHWDVNWSRIGMHGVTVPFFELWTMAALLRGLRTGRLTSFVWAGVALGLGLCFYSPMRIFPAIVGGFLLVWLVQWLWRLGREDPSWPASKKVRHALAVWTMPLLLLVLGVMVAVAPVVQFAVHYPDQFWERAKKISLVQDPTAKADLVGAVLRSASRHLLMFNYEGDPNGRHNLPGRPMLDRLSGVLFVMGIVIALFRWRDPRGGPRAVLLILWLLVPLIGGIFSVSFESPQSLRSIGAMPAAYLLVSVTMAWFAAEWRHIFGTARRLAGVAVAFMLAIGLAEGWTYLVVWANDFSSWGAFNPAETHMAQDINVYREQYDLRFDPLLTAHMATRYLAPDYTSYRHFDPAMVFPIQGGDKEGVLLFISPDTYLVREDAQRFYPGVQVEKFAHDNTDRIVLYKYIFSNDVISSVQGIDASYVSLQASDTMVRYQVESAIDLDWGDTPPAPYPLQAAWTGSLLAPQYGIYTLRVDVSGEARLVLDGQLVFSGSGPQQRQISMAQGVHALHLECQVVRSGLVRLSWAAPVGESNSPTANSTAGDPNAAQLSPVPHDSLYRSLWPVNGLVGRFYAGGDLNSEPKIVRIDRRLAYYFHFLPMPRPYRVEWTGQLLAPIAGEYRLGVKAITSASLYVDGQLVLENSATGQYQDAPLNLTAGMHDIRISFLDGQDRSQIYLYWQLPGDTGIQLIAPEFLFLPSEGAWWDIR